MSLKLLNQIRFPETIGVKASFFTLCLNLSIMKTRPICLFESD